MCERVQVKVISGCEEKALSCMTSDSNRFCNAVCEILSVVIWIG